MSDLGGNDKEGDGLGQKGAVAPSDSAAFRPDAWPVAEGRYRVGNKESPIAVCTMSSVDMEFPMDRIAIAGKCVTENMGIEKIVKNTVSNPNIRYMVICGKVPMGHFVDNAIVSLIDNGVDSEGRIIGAKGGIPVVKNLSEEEIERFRRQVIPVSMAGETDVSKVMEKVDELFDRNPGPFVGQAVVSEDIETVQASHTEADFVPDPKGYFLIEPNLQTKEMVVTHYETSGKATQKIRGRTAEELYHTIMRMGLVSRLEHAAYMGRELARAEVAIRTGCQSAGQIYNEESRSDKFER
jgi:tetrahydromethanopterin S-methyltransferase subunit A